MECNKVSSGARKVKKKQVKDELDRIKQAEKKRRRLEKALATSAAIRSELEKKKQQKKEEQQRLDEQGAAIAEAVALHVLGEDSDDVCRVVWKKDEKFNPWDCGTNFDFLTGGKNAFSPYQDMPKYSLEEIGWVSDAHRSGCKLSNCGNIDWTITSGSFCGNIPMTYCDERDWEERGISAGLIAAQAVSSLQIGEDAQVDALVFNGLL